MNCLIEQYALPPAGIVGIVVAFVLLAIGLIGTFDIIIMHYY
jgi:uncharacterized membrane protein